MAKNDKILELALKRFKLSQEGEAPNRLSALESMRFVDGDQWPSEIKEERKKDGRPCLTINKLRKFVKQVVADIRQNKVGVKVRPVDNEADVIGAEVRNDLIRHIEDQSDANIVYETGMEQALDGGFGYWRLVAEYSDNEFHQEIRLKRVPNRFTIYLDQSAQGYNYEDGKFAFITETVSKEDFETLYPGKNVKNMSEGAGEEAEGWFHEDKVRIAEYFYKEPVTKTIGQLDTGEIVNLDKVITAKKLTEVGINVVKTREVKSHKVMWCKISGGEVLDGPKEFPSKFIPVVPVLGIEINEEGKRKFRSLIYDAMDSMRMYNYWNCLSLDTPMPTPGGWVTMGDVKAGDKLFDEKGNICNVIGISPIHTDKVCYKIVFDDKSEIIADAGHIWKVEERGKRVSASWKWEDKHITTVDIVPGKHFINQVKALELPEADLPIHPYFLGYWLGDGDSARPYITCGNHDIDEVRANIERLGYVLGPSKRDKNGVPRFAIYGVNKIFNDLGVINNKHIPNIYLRASKKQREMLLQGLMDSDGSIDKVNQCSFTTTSPLLSEGFAELIRSLGIKAKICKRINRKPIISLKNGKSYNPSPSDQFSFTGYSDNNVFFLKRKSAIPRVRHYRRTKRHSIISIEQIPSVPVRCVQVDSESHLFLAGIAMIPTHNTHATETIALAPKAPYTITPEQIEGHETMWQTANTKNLPYLVYNDVPGQGKPSRERPPDVPAAALSQMNIASADIMDTIGMYQASLGQESNERSGRAIIARQKAGDAATYTFIDNFTRAIIYTGKILIDMMPRVYDNERIVRLRGKNGEDTSMLAINKTIQNPATLETITINDLSVGEYDLISVAGPTYESKRQETAASMLDFIQFVPQAAPVIGPRLAEVMDWPGAQEIAKELKKMIMPPPPGLGGGSPAPSGETPRIGGMPGAQ